MKKILIIGGIAAGVAVLGIAGFVIAKKVKAGGGLLGIGGSGATPDSAMGFIPGVEVGHLTRRKYIKYLSNWATQTPSGLANIQPVNTSDPTWSTCRNCLIYGKGQPDYPGPGKHSPTALWWSWMAGSANPTDCEPPKCQSYDKYGNATPDEYLTKVYAKIGCNPMKGGSENPASPEYGNYECMGRFMRAAEEYKNSCEACRNIPLMPFTAV